MQWQCERTGGVPQCAIYSVTEVRGAPLTLFLVCHAEYDDDGAPDPATFKVMVDGGTEGLKGHARVIIPGLTPCFDCTLWLFPPQTKFPLCTLAETPRSGALKHSKHTHHVSSALLLYSQVYETGLDLLQANLLLSYVTFSAYAPSPGPFECSDHQKDWAKACGYPKWLWHICDYPSFQLNLFGDSGPWEAFGSGKLERLLHLAVPVHRSPAHCIEYVHLIQWQQERGAEEFDADEEDHMRWVYDRALQRAEQFGIQVRIMGGAEMSYMEQSRALQGQPVTILSVMRHFCCCKRRSSGWASVPFKYDMWLAALYDNGIADQYVRADSTCTLLHDSQLQV